MIYLNLRNLRASKHTRFQDDLGLIPLKYLIAAFHCNDRWMASTFAQLFSLFREIVEIS